jgi:hypothetical protein
MVATTLEQQHVSAAQVETTNSSFTFAKAVISAGRVGLMGLCAIMIIAALHPDVRSAMRGTFIKDYRTVVSTAQGNLAGDERVFTVTKIKTSDSLSLEIFETLSNGRQKMVEKIALPDSRDGYFDFNGQATNLAIDDIDGNGQPEILVPTFDNNLVGRLNVYNFDASSKTFQKLIR